MRFPLIPIIVLLIFNGIIDLCFYRILLRYYHNKLLANIQRVLSVVFALLLLVAIFMPKRGGSDGELLWVMWSMYAYFSVYIPKYLFLIFHLIARIPNIWKGKTLRPVSLLGAGVAVVSFLLMWWGALINRNNIQVVDVDMPIAGLPQAFDGVKIAQISDLHVGTFGRDTVFVSKLVDSINSLRPDVIVFTGDIVNRRSEEFEPFIGVMGRLVAPLGIYSIMGNHDYGDYSAWPSPQDKVRDVLHIKSMQAEAGMTMLNNSHTWIKIGNDSIALIGVENIGDPPFTVYGDLMASYPDLKDNNVKILLSHNPAHWESEIEDSDNNIALTLSGHTHAMQLKLFGISPAALRYDKWGGLYEDTKGHKLYVNIGAGEVGFPSRIGATPEITLFTLRQTKQ